MVDACRALWIPLLRCAIAVHPCMAQTRQIYVKEESASVELATGNKNVVLGAQLSSADPVRGCRRAISWPIAVLISYIS
jgi:hypothetical protein